MEQVQKFSASECASQPDQRKLYNEDGIGFVELLEHFGTDLTVVNAARVSFQKESAFFSLKESDGSGSLDVEYQLSNRDAKLVEFLADHRHVTPFFHPMVRLRIKMPIFIVREWYRHTVGFARNEVSRRYVTDAPECFCTSKLRRRDKNIKQGSSSQLIDDNDKVSREMKEFIEQACDYYQKLLDSGVCPEQARMILPQSMYTEFIETASLAGYARLVILRDDAAAQREIQGYARRVSQLIEPIFPVSWKALIKAGV